MTGRAIDVYAPLRRLRAVAGNPERYIVAYSGGLDSTVLLHALATQQNDELPPLLAIHVNHQLQAQADQWQQHCANFAKALGIDFEARLVEVCDSDGLGPEAAARSARYATLQSLMSPGDCVLTAHHLDDQAETVLLNLLRGSGPAGSAGIPPVRSLSPGWLLRPLLEYSRAELAAYAEEHELHWLEDGSNAELSFDRNFLRHRVIPELASRWPDAAARLARSADLHREASTLLRQVASNDMTAMPETTEHKLSVDALLAMSRPRCRNLLRTAVTDAGLAAVPAAQLERILDEVLPARRDATPAVRWRGGIARRFRGSLYLDSHDPEPQFDEVLTPGHDISLGIGMGRLGLRRVTGAGLDSTRVERGLRLKKREGGEKIRPSGQAHTRTIKKLLNEDGVVPWMRDKIPLLYSGEDLVAVGDLWIDAGAQCEGGWEVQWRDRPVLY